jgi:hypothetical protein
VLESLPGRLRAKIAPNDAGCWIWRASVSHKGYGHYRFRGRVWQAHRAVYTILRGEIPEGMQIDHLCRVRGCVNPAHLEVVTPLENWVRGYSVTANYSRQDCCKYGHPFTPENTNIRSRGARQCRTCNRENCRKNYDAARKGRYQGRGEQYLVC